MIIYINKQLNGKTTAEINAANFPRLYDGEIRIRNISIIEHEDSLDIQTIYHPDELKRAIRDFLRREYQ